MLTRTATRRSAAVLMLALVAMLLVATGGSAHGTQARVSVGNGHASATPHLGRHAAAIPPATQDQSPLHLDLATTPPVTADALAAVVADRSAGAESAPAPGGIVTPVGRAPPAR